VTYHHRHHAGNFGDVLKHITLVELLRRLTVKENPCFCLDTHAGRGDYVLTDTGTREASRGVLKLIAAKPQSAAIRAWLDLVRASDPRNTATNLVSYPGSPRLVQLLLRPGDRAAFFELAPREAAALSGTLERDKRVHIECGDGYQSLRALLPPRERRGLVFIDPAYEQQERELDQALGALRAGFDRWPTGIYCLWYPIKERRALARLKHAFVQRGWPPTLAAELCVYRDDSRAGLNGAGVLILNPPWQLDVAMREWVQELHGILAIDPAARWSVEWLVPDR
jgi:23S rRNA (adenine2030-N6)-methyltransferase